MDWSIAAKRLYEETVAWGLQSTVQDFLTRPECNRILLACSGGADSVFMSCQLWARAREFDVEFVFAHYNHRWRGDASTADAQFVETMAQQLGCSFAMDTRPDDITATTETQARALRIDFLRAAAKAYQCAGIAFGHQRDDILETQLQRLARGSGTDGLAAPRPIHFFDSHPPHIRPLLHLSAIDIRTALKENGIPWREDESNINVDIPRNALRQEIIPDLQAALVHDVHQGAARSRFLLEEDASALNQMANAVRVKAAEADASLKRAVLCAAPRALTRRVLLNWLAVHEVTASFSALAMDDLLDAIYTQKKTHRASAGAAFIELNATHLRIETRATVPESLQPASLQVGEFVVLSTGAQLRADFVSATEPLLQQLQAGAVDCSREAYVDIGNCLALNIRARQPGDCFQPLGAPGKKKLKDLFIDRKIPIQERNALPVVSIQSGAIVWVPGFPPAEAFKINATTKLALQLTYQISEPL